MLNIKNLSSTDFKKVKPDANGNPRYVISYIALGLDAYESTRKTRAAGLRKYRGRDFGGGFVFSSYNPQHDLNEIMKTIHDK